MLAARKFGNVRPAAGRDKDAPGADFLAVGEANLFAGR